MVTTAMRDLGLEAYSCDTEEPSGGHPEWHLRQDVRDILHEDWDLIIAFPPCTHLAKSGNRWFPQKRADGRQQQGIDFFLLFTDLECPKVAIENPIGVMNRIYRKPDQIINPYQFGDPYRKATCLWLKGLPPLVPTHLVDMGERVTYTSGKNRPRWILDLGGKSPKERARLRSATFPGIAKAMADQWGVPCRG